MRPSISRPITLDNVRTAYNEMAVGGFNRLFETYERLRAAFILNANAFGPEISTSIFGKLAYIGIALDAMCSLNNVDLLIIVGACSLTSLLCVAIVLILPAQNLAADMVAQALMYCVVIAMSINAKVATIVGSAYLFVCVASLGVGFFYGAQKGAYTTNEMLGPNPRRAMISLALDTAFYVTLAITFVLYLLILLTEVITRLFF